MDGSFHTPEWHAARLASLKTSHTVTWEEFKKKQKVTYSATLMVIGECTYSWFVVCRFCLLGLHGFKFDQFVAF